MLSGGHPGAGELPTQLGAERAPGPPQHLDDRRAHHVNPTDATTPAPRHPRLRLMSSTLPDRYPTDRGARRSAPRPEYLLTQRIAAWLKRSAPASRLSKPYRSAVERNTSRSVGSD